ncbi:radical SAM family heme chaperone HemW [Longirhabdus pacifica]|uniref:radical SAM family heme chaperone HemW n=1 Tax=Longirhabdus pacifica TaxID=2305227 RepID=UPI0010088C38|nr:radical SAM family heme chaperone HemW [Longirhabdus pacifica]
MYKQHTPEAVYVHIPFCKQKCFYCDFNTYALKGQPVDDYLQALEKEMQQIVTVNPPEKIKTIFVGGGTPTALLPKQMEQLMQMIHRYFPLDRDAYEFTVEANPGSTDDEKLDVMHEYGVNRLSFGVQAFQNDLLTSIGRFHDVDDVYRSIATAKKVGFQNISIDLIFGLPQQTLAQVKESVQAALQLDLQHYSLYGLKVEENTLFYKQLQNDMLKLPDEDDELQMYMYIIDTLQQAGYHQYEISNFALPSYESKHNNMYWRNQSYYGLGAGAHGYVKGIRHANVKRIADYIEAVQHGIPVADQHEVSRREAMEDFMMVGFRLIDGVKQEDFVQQFDQKMEEVFASQLHHLLEKKLIQKNKSGYSLTKQGIKFGNEVFSAFI